MNTNFIYGNNRSKSIILILKHFQKKILKNVLEILLILKKVPRAFDE